MREVLIFTQLPKVNCVQKQLRGKVCVEKTQPTSVQINQEISSAFLQPSGHCNQHQLHIIQATSHPF